MLVFLENQLNYEQANLLNLYNPGSVKRKQLRIIHQRMLQPKPSLLSKCPHLRAALPSKNCRSLRCNVARVQTYTPTLTVQDLIGYFEPKTVNKQPVIGLEHEKICYKVTEDGLLRASYQQMAELIRCYSTEYDWDLMFDYSKYDSIVWGARKGQTSITLEPGAQLELSGKPHANLQDVELELQEHFQQLHSLAREKGFRFLTCGFDPICVPGEECTVDRYRYNLLQSYMDRYPSGKDVLWRGCSAQVNLDYFDEQDMVKKFRVCLALQPIATAICANSPFAEGRATGHMSYRTLGWSQSDVKRTGMLPFVFEDDMGYKKLVEHILQVPMMFAKNEQNELVDAQCATFADFMAGNVPSMPGHRPDLDDWDFMLGTLYPETRVKKWLEMRGADSCPRELLMALSAFWVGLLYDPNVLEEVHAIIMTWDNDERQMLYQNAAQYGLQARFRGNQTVVDLAQLFVMYAGRGLQARNQNEAHYLNPFKDIVSRGYSRAEQFMDMSRVGQNQGLDFVFQELSDEEDLR